MAWRQKWMDRTSLNLLSLLLGGAGVLVVFTKFNVPELNMTFLSENPFAIKRDAIDYWMTWIFTLLTLVGVFIQIILQIMGDRLHKRLHGAKFYASLFLVYLVVVAVLVFGLTVLGKLVARRIWLPKVVSMMTEGYRKAKFIIDNGGWRQDQLAKKDTLQDPERYRQANFDSAEKIIAQMEKLLELTESWENLESRLVRLRPFFANK